MNNKDLILQYGKRGIVVSGGPACSADSDEPSHVLRALGIPADKINNSIRISFNANTTLDDAQKFIAATKEILGEN